MRRFDASHVLRPMSTSGTGTQGFRCINGYMRNNQERSYSADHSRSQSRTRGNSQGRRYSPPSASVVNRRYLFDEKNRKNSRDRKGKGRGSGGRDRRGRDISGPEIAGGDRTVPPRHKYVATSSGDTAVLAMRASLRAPRLHRPQAIRLVVTGLARIRARSRRRGGQCILARSGPIPASARARSANTCAKHPFLE